MALLNCPECGKEISDTVKKCPNCGFVNKEVKKEKIDKVKKFIKNNIKVISIIIIVLIIGIVGFIIHNKKVEQDRIKANRLTSDEKMIASVIKKLQSSLKNPDSLQVFEIIYSKSEDGSAAVIIDASGQNGFGGTTRRRYMYLTKADGTITYWGDDYRADETITKYTSMDDSLEIGISKLIREYWTKREDYVVADVDKIMRNLEQAKLKLKN